MSTIEINADSAAMNAGVDYYLEHSKVKSNGVREVPVAAFVSRMETHGVTKEDAKRVQDAINFETTVAARLALALAEKKLQEATAEELKDDDFRKTLRTVVRIPTFGGNTEVECQAERWDNIPFQGDGEKSHKVTHGRFRTTINAKSRIDPVLHDEARDRIRKIIGFTE